MTLFTEAQKQEILSIAQQHSKIEAIKWIRDHSDLGLKQAKDYVENLLENSIDHSTFQSSTDSSTSSSSIPLQEIHLMLQQGRKIEAIKLVKDSSNIGLKEAKDLVDECVGRTMVVLSKGMKSKMNVLFDRFDPSIVQVKVVDDKEWL